jgi:hypothetical protein
MTASRLLSILINPNAWPNNVDDSILDRLNHNAHHIEHEALSICETIIKK